MFPTSAVASPIFAGVWALVFLGAARSFRPTSPFGHHWREHTRRHLDDVRSFRDSLIRDAHFSPTIAEMLLDDWKASSGVDAPIAYPDADSVDVQIAAYANALRDWRELRDLDRSAFIEQAIRLQLVYLFDGLLLAARGAELEAKSFERGALEGLLWIASTLVGDRSMLDVSQPRELLQAVVGDWQNTSEGTSRGRDPKLDAWLEGYVGMLSSG